MAKCTFAGTSGEDANTPVTVVVSVEPSDMTPASFGTSRSITLKGLLVEIIRHADASFAKTAEIFQELS